MAISCSIATPLVKGKPSKLYTALLKKLGSNNKMLVNLIYSTAISNSFKNQLDSSKFDILGEPKLSELEKVIDFGKFTISDADLQSALKYVGATDSSGKTITYTELTKDILQRIKDFNDKNEVLRARYLFRDNKYRIVIEPITSTNYNTNEKIAKSEAKYEACIEFLNEIGLSTDWSDESKIYRNRTNGFTLMRDLENMINADSKHRYVAYPTQWNFIKDLFKHNRQFNGLLNSLRNLIKNKVKDKYKDYDDEKLDKRVEDLLNTLLYSVDGNENYLSRTDKEFIEDVLANNENIVNLAEAAVDTIFDPISGDFYKKINSLKGKVAVSKLADKDKNIEEQNWNKGKFLKVDLSEISEIIKILNDRYYINSEIVSNTEKDIKTISSLARTFEQKLVKELELYKGAFNKIIDRDGIYYDEDESAWVNLNKNERHNLESKIRHIISNIKRQSYAQSIASCLDGIFNDFKELSNVVKTDIPNKEDIEDIGQFIRTNSYEILQLKKIINAYKSTVVMCMNIDTLINDQFNVPEDLIPYIKNTAKTLNSLFDEISGKIVNKQFALVEFFLRTYGKFGDEDKIDIDGEVVSLRDLLEIAQKDVNFFDRFVYSLNESNDLVLSLIHQTIKSAQVNRDKQLREVDYILRTALEELGGDTEFMFNRNSEGRVTGFLTSNYNFELYEKDLKELKDKLHKENKPQSYIDKVVAAWEREHTVEIDLFADNKEFEKIYTDLVTAIYGKNHILNNKQVRSMYTVVVPSYKDKNGNDRYALDRISKLSVKERTYYYKTMALKHMLTHQMPDYMRYKFFEAVQIQSDLVNRFENAQNVRDVVHILGQSFKDKFVRNEADVSEYPNFYETLEINGITPILTDHNGNIVKKIPIYYTTRLQDLSRMSTNMNASMTAFAAMALNYNNLNAIIDPLEITKDLIANGRKIQEQQGVNTLLDVFNYGGKLYANLATKIQGTDSINATLDDFFERNVYGNKKKKEDVVLFGKTISVDKAADSLIGLTSSMGLTTNILGAIANELVGKIQMTIEASAGEFFNFKDFAVAELKYFQYLPEYLNEVASNNKKSLMKLLGEAFDVEEDAFRKIAEKGYNKNALKRIFHNKNLTILYGIGEHILHYMGMLAVLHNIKVWDKQKQCSVPALDMFDVVGDKNSKNGKLYIDYNRYEFIEEDGSRRKLTEEDVFGKEIRGRIAYTNKSLHGNFSDVDKGNLHRYAIGRMLNNFRQWMPAHYQRRFRSKHYDADLGEFRRGYYVSNFKFLGNVIKSWVHAKPGIATSWNELSRTDQYNVKRAIAETAMMVLLSAQIFSMGTYKDHKHNWAARMYLYTLNRLYMETKASTPFSGMGFFNNLINLLNSPMSSLSTIDTFKNLINYRYIFETVNSGKHKGENKLYHTWETKAPYWSKIRTFTTIGEEDAMFNLFKED